MNLKKDKLDIRTLIKRLHRLGINDISEDALQKWAYHGLIPRSEPVEKYRGPGHSTEYPEQTVEEAAAVWYIRKALGERNTPWKDVKRARHVAKEYHKALMTDFDACNKFWRSDVSPTPSPIALSLSEESQQHFVHEDGTGVGTYTHSYDLHPLIVLWICTVEKVKYIRKEKGGRHNILIDTPVRVSFDWAATEGGLQFRGTHAEKAKQDTVTIHGYTPDTREGYEFERIYYPEYLPISSKRDKIIEGKFDL